MRLLACLALAASLPALAADTSGRTAVVVIPPVADPKVPQGLNLAMQEKASALLIGTGRYDIIHARQVKSMALRHRMADAQLADPNVARQAAERLGAQLFVYSKLVPVKKEGFSLSISV